MSPTNHKRCILLFTLALLDSACLELHIDPILDSLDELPGGADLGSNPSMLYGDPERGIWINNGLDDPDVSGIDPTYSLSSPEGLAEDKGMLLDPDQHDTLRYLVECALPEGHAITKRIDGREHTFEGLVGIAPEWEDDECDEDCQEWVSACLLARTNVSGKEVNIWMRADHPAIGEGSSLEHPTLEASFFGNLFADGSSGYFCAGNVAGSLLSQLKGRTCAGLTTESCGFTKYTACEQEQRCSFAPGSELGLNVTRSPANCIAGEIAEGHSFHTITTYVGPL
jgi:hypothetical protein